MSGDVTQNLKDTENSLREFITTTLQSSLGTGWEERCGLAAERKVVEEKRQKGGVVEERLIYYADFYDLQNILKKHWDKFAPALGDWKVMEVYLGELEKLRDPDAHRRELLPHQKNLAAGIAGEIRTRLIRYRSKQETSEDYFPRIESVRDSLGNIWVPGSIPELRDIMTKMVLRPGDTVDFVVTASDPLGHALSFSAHKSPVGAGIWQESNTFSVMITDADIGRDFVVSLLIQSSRQYHAHIFSDDYVVFHYTVLPKKVE
jgi:hypothetical protein